MEATLLEEWIEKEKRVALLSKRRYLHFDRFIIFYKNQDQLIKQLQDIDQIATHAFYPFVSIAIDTPRLKLLIDSEGRKQRVHELKSRPIAYASHYDAYIYSWYATQLTDLYQKKLKSWGIEDCVLAYLKKDKSNINFAFEAFTAIKKLPQCAAIAIDLKSFFDTLDH